MPGATRARSSKRKQRRRPAKASEQVEQLCRLWRSVLRRRDGLIEEAAGDDRSAYAARASLERLDAELARYVSTQRGQRLIKRIGDRWCGGELVEALRLTETLFDVLLGEG